MARGETSSKRVISKDDWSRKLQAVKLRKEDMNRLVMNFLVTEGYVDAAKVFEKESGTAPGVQLGAITGRMLVRQDVQKGDIESAIERVNDLDPGILEEKHTLAFHLHQQRLIELIRGGSVTEALVFAQDYLAPLAEEHPALLEELERTVALLAFEDVASSPVSDLMDIAQRQKTASELNAAILASQGQEKEPRLPGLLKMLLWAQGQLDEKTVFPHIDLATGRLDEEASISANGA